MKRTLLPQNGLMPSPRLPWLSLLALLLSEFGRVRTLYAIDDPEMGAVLSSSPFSLWQSLLGMGLGILVLAAVLKWNHRLGREVEERRQIEQRLSLALEGGNLGLWDVDLLSETMIVNGTWAEMLGYTLEEITPLHRSFWLNTIHPNDRERVLQLGQACLNGQEERYVAEYRAITKTGNIRWLVSRGAIVSYADDGKATRMVGTVLDITTRKQMEEALRASEARHALILASVADGIFVMDTNGITTFANQAAASILGWSVEELIGIPMHSTIHHTFANGAPYPASQCPTRKAYQQGIPSHVEDELYWRKDGTGIPIEYSSVPMRQEGRLIGAAVVFRDVSQRRQAETRIRILNQLVYGSLESASVGAWWIDFNEEDTFHALDTTARLLGMPSSTASDKSYRLSELMQLLTHTKELCAEHADHVDETLTALQGTISGKSEFFNSTFPSLLAGERLRWLNVRGYVAQRNHEGKALLMTGTVIDITDQKDVELAMEEAKQAAEEAARVKSDFLANMSHEIRTPMNGIIGMLDLMQQSALNASQRRMLSTIQESSLSLLNILNDILDFSKIEAGKMVVERTPMQLREVVEGAVQLMFATASNKSLDLSVFVDPQLPRWLLADPTRLRQIILNLVGNAVKFTSSTPQQQGRVAVRAELHKDKQHHFSLHIRDNGIGIAQENLKKLFRPFSQADASTSRKYGGTGLGLSITHRLVELMGGTITVQSIPGSLTEFTVTLPLEPSAPPPTHSATSEIILQGLTLYIVAGDTIYAQILLAYSQAAGAQSVLFASLEQLQQHWQTDPPAQEHSLLLVDAEEQEIPAHSLPAGIRLLRLQRQARAASWSGCVAIPAMPLLYQELIANLAVASGRMKASALVAMTERRQRPRQAVPSIDEAIASGTLILLAEDNEINREVISEQLRLLGYAAEVAEDGEVALHMWRSGRYALLLTDCHMPNRDGFSLTTAILQEEKPGQHRPIIAVTANALQGEAERCLAHGMDDYLSKPLRMAELGAMLNKWLPLAQNTAADSANEHCPTTATTKEISLTGTTERRASSTDKGEPSHPSSVAAQQEEESMELPLWDASTISRMVGENPQMQRRLLEKFLHSAPQQMGAIQEALEAGQMDKVGQIAHAFKSAARMVGALRLGELLQTTERAGKAGDEEQCKQLLWPTLQGLMQESQLAIEAFLQHKGDSE
ncbi:PAS domain S-box protein [Candidatus Magnetaquicoccus inordinatus]|uniref:PAS domain S-box protein n=1 Tax=Candidatus Magnetaquicoccus inordinatus TaxID=2496818 RepID=UPI00102B96E4|nr:PAS domain S-box protein [Candidatus Magnetaquicoccus inordinatus]